MIYGICYNYLKVIKHDRKKIIKFIEESKKIRERSVASYYDDVFHNLSKFVSKKLNSPLFKKRNAKIIANYFDEILPYIVMSNIDILNKKMLKYDGEDSTLICRIKTYIFCFQSFTV